MDNIQHLEKSPWEAMPQFDIKILGEAHQYLPV